MPSKTYKTVYRIDDRQPKLSHKEAMQAAKALEAQYLRVAKASESAIAGAGKGGGLTSQLAGVDRLTKATRDGAAARVKAEMDAAQKISVGYYKLVSDSIKAQDKARAGVSAMEAAMMASANKQKAASQQVAQAQTQAAKSSAGAWHQAYIDQGLEAQKAAAKSARSAEMQAERDAKAAQKRAERAVLQAEKEAAAYDKIQDRKVRADERAADRKAKGDLKAAERAQKLADKDAADYDKRAARQQQRDDKAADLKVQRAERAARAVERSEAGPLARLAQFQRKALNDEQIHAAARNKYIDVTNKKRVDGAMRAMGAEHDSFAQGISGALGLEQMATKAGIALLGIGAAKAGIMAVAGALFEARKNAEGFGKTAADFMISLRPLASVMGVKPDFAFAENVARFGVETAMPKADAANFLESFAGRAQITKGKQISDAEYEKFTTMAGKMTTARGVPVDVAGDLFASVLKIENFKNKGQGAKEATARAGGLFDILDAGSGKIKELAPQAQQLMAALASENELEGVFKNAGEVGVMTSLMAENNPAESAVFARATIKALSQFGDKGRQPFYARAGIEAGMPALERVKRANTVFEEEVGKGRPLESVLEGFGLAGDVREKTGLATAYKARNTVLAPQLERMKSFEGPGGADKVLAKIDDRFKDLDVQTSKARAENEAADLQSKALSANVYRERAEGQLKREGYMTDPFRILSTKIESAASLFQVDGMKSTINARALALARKDAGVDPTVSVGESVWGDTDAKINQLIEVMKKNEAAKKAAAIQAVPGPQAMNGVFGVSGWRGALTASMMGALPERAGGFPLMKIGRFGEYAPGGNAPKALPGADRRLPDTERLITGNVELPTDPVELARIKGLGDHKEVGAAEKARIAALGLPKPVAEAERLRIATLGVRKPVTEAERLRIATLGVRKPMTPKLGSWAESRFEGFGAERAALPDAAESALSALSGFGSVPAKADAAIPYNPYDELEGADVWPGYSERGGKIGSMKQVDLRTNAERLLPQVPRGENWISSKTANMMGGGPLGPGGLPMGPGGVPAQAAQSSQVEKDTLAVLKDIKQLLQGNGVSRTPDRIPLKGTRDGPGR